ncbi:hypothetical protein FO519_006768 [Halicephalobus sp. NKZ332]|nr:hypothetical protein FO519_006768 [Halicephalobus sp. NKZ332]
MPNCQKLDLEPETFEDWNILENSSCVVEELFLDQVRILQNGMSFVLFVGPNVPVKFKVVRTEPETGRESAVMIDNSTEVVVIPKENPMKDRFPSRASSRPSTTTSFFADKIGGSENLSESTLIKEFIFPQEKELNEHPNHCVLSSSLMKNKSFQECSWITVAALGRQDVSEVKQFSLQDLPEDLEVSKKNIEEVIGNDFSCEDHYLPTLISSHGLSLTLESNCKLRLIVLI